MNISWGKTCWYIIMWDDSLSSWWVNCCDCDTWWRLCTKKLNLNKMALSTLKRKIAIVSVLNELNDFEEDEIDVERKSRGPTRGWIRWNFRFCSPRLYFRCGYRSFFSNRIWNFFTHICFSSSRLYVAKEIWKVNCTKMLYSKNTCAAW